MYSKLFTGAFSLFSIFAMGSSALAWSDMGHTIVGGMAEQNIKPSTKDFVRGILGVEPLEVAAIWPDHVRDDDRFGHKNKPPLAILADDHNFADYHFCEIPTGYNYATRPNKDFKDCHGAILGAEEILRDVSGLHTHAEKLIALRYLVHVVGDMHQPLHVGNGYDIGANVCKVLWKKPSLTSAPPVQFNLHAFWDDNMVQILGASYADPSKKKPAAAYVDSYLSNFRERRPDMFTPEAKSKYGSGTLEDWLQESADLRESGVYPDDPAQMAGVAKGEEYKNRPYCEWFTDQVNSVIAKGSVIDKTKIPLITPGYIAKFTPIVETQLMKAGLRLASILDKIADDAAAAGPLKHTITDAQQEKILSGVQSAFENKD